MTPRYPPPSDIGSANNPTQKVRLTPKLPGIGTDTLEVSTGVWKGEPYVRVVGRNANGEAVTLYDLAFHVTVLPNLIAALRWVVAGPLEQQIIDKERER